MLERSCADAHPSLTIRRVIMILSRTQRFLLLSLLAAGPAWAKAADSRENEARTACLSGDYAKGAAILSQLFVETKDATFIYNQGRCFEQNHRYEDAIARFREFLRVGKRLSKADKADAEKHIADCQGLLAQQAPAAAPAAEQSSKDAKQRAAKKACLTGDPAAGVAILTDLYLDTGDPTHLFNQGRCFEQNRRYEDAIGRFREYLVKAKGLTAEVRADTEKHISDCESYLQKKPGEPAKPEPPKTAVEAPTAGQITPAVVTARPPVEEAGRPGRGLRIAGTVVAALGVAGVATGVVLNLEVNSMSNDLEGDWNPDANSTREGYKTAGWIAYGAGAACMVGGVVLYLLGRQRGEHSASVAIVPTVGRDMAGTSVVGVF
jgi:hypothetical protein